MDRRRGELLVAGLQVVCALVAGGYLVGVGLAAEASGAGGRSALDRAFPFLAAAAVLVALLVMAARSLARARRAAAPPSPARPAAVEPVVVAGDRDRPPAVELSADGRRELDRLVAALGDLGLLAPRVPDPADLVEAVADAGEPVTVDTVLAGLSEADWWRPGFRPEDHLAALVFHDSHVEQDAASLAGQVADLARLVGPALPVRLDDVTLVPEGGAVRTRVRLVLGTEVTTLVHRGHATYLSTVLHVAVARALHAVTAVSGGPRLAWHWTDQGVWLAAPAPGVGVEQLDAALHRPGTEPWTWVDVATPVEAGA